jgi:uncharacterized glyoxalase superfamily protein PhnB
MTHIKNLTIEAADTEAAAVFYKTAFGLDDLVRVREAEGETRGFRAFTISLLTRQPADVDALVDAALAAGATSIKPVTKSFWGYGGVVQAPDGSIWKVASSSKKDTAPPSTQVEQVVLLVGCEDVAASKRFYIDQGLMVARSFGRKYVEFAARPDGITFGLYGRRALAKDAGVPPEGTGSHRIVIGSDAGAFTDPDGFGWEPAS